MEIENTLSTNIDASDQKAALDASCKRLLANKNILAWILKDCVEEYKDCSISDIAEKYIEGDAQISQVAVHPDVTNPSIRGMNTEDKTITEGTVTYDIRFMATAPGDGGLISLIINIEAQNRFNVGYPLIKRGIYYLSRMISAQYGTEFTASHYEDVKKVYSIWICTNPSDERKGSITSYSIRENNLIGSVKEKRENYDLMTAVMVCLGDSSEDESTLKLLEVLLSNKDKANEKKKILQEEFDIEMTQILDEEVSLMCNISEGIEAKGIEKGRVEGIEKGSTDTINEVIANMRKLGMSEETIKEVTQGVVQNVTRIS